MSKERFRFTGIVARNNELEVVFTEDVGGTHRVRSIGMPYQSLMSEEVTTQLDKLVRRRLIEMWSEVDIADPLF